VGFPAEIIINYTSTENISLMNKDFKATGCKTYSTHTCPSRIRHILPTSCALVILFFIYQNVVNTHNPLLEKLTVAQLAKKFPASYET
jgi:hypothetical protein